MNPKQQFTPGTWDYELTEIDSGNPQRPLCGPLVVYATWANEESVTVCTLDGTPEMNANARLIAAAPAMYVALQNVIREYEDGYGLKCIEEVRAALKAATGDHR